MPSTLINRPRLWASAALVVALYAAVGFWLLPAVLRSGVHDYLVAKHQRQLTLGEVRFNPFTLRLDVGRTAVADVDGAPLFGFAHLSADVAVASIWRHGIALNNVRLEAPRVRIIERPDGAINLMDLLPPSDPHSPVPKVWIRSLAIASGEATFIDRARLTPFEVAITAFSFDMHDFSTLSQANSYHLAARSKLDARFEWNGTFGVDPFVSKGTMRIDNFRAQSIADAGRNLLPLNIAHGTLDLNGRYDYLMRGAAGALVLDVDELVWHDVGLSAREQTDSWVDIPKLRATGTHIDFGTSVARVAQLRVDGARINAWRERDGSINLSHLYVPLPTQASDTPSKPWELQVPEVAIGNADVVFTDRTPATAARFHLGALQLAVSGYASSTTEPLRIALQSSVNETGHVAANGTLALQPLAGAATLQFDALPLKALQPYLGAVAALKIKSGLASFRGTTALTSAGGIELDGDGSVDNLRTIDTALEEDFVKWDSMRMLGLHMRTKPMSIAIQTLIASAPYARVIIGSNGKTNLAAALGGNRVSPPAPGAKPVAGAGLPIDIGVVRISEGRMNFADYSVKPRFAASIQRLSGSVTDLSSRQDSRATLDLTGQVDRYAPVTIAGKVNFLAATHFADVRMNFKNLELTGLSPYAGKFAGYWIDKGKMSAELEYHIDDRKLDANHHIVVNQMQLGAHVDSPEATSLPIRLAIALLKDKDGVIDLNLPIKGSLDDPDFRVGRIVWQVFVNLLEKAVTSPFRLLGALFGGGEELQYLEFAAGDPALDAATRAKTATLVKALAARPELSLDVPLGYAAEFDTPALAARKWQTQRHELAVAALGERAEQPGAVEQLLATPARYRALLESAYAEAFGHPALPPAAAIGTAAEVAAAAAIAWLEGELQSRINIGQRQLENLAAARARAVQGALLDGTGIDPGRVFVVKALPQTVVNEHLRLQLVLH